MQIKIIALAVCSLSLFSGNSYAWIEYVTDPEPLSDAYYTESTDYAFNDSPSYQETKRVLYKKPRSVSGNSSPSSRLPRQIASTGEKTIVVDPRVHAWGAYSSEGKLIRSGRATAGARWCSDIGRPCQTKTGVFRIASLGDSSCVSKKFPVGEGGAPMPYCMYFNGGQALHGSYQVVDKNVSHGCVRLSVQDAQWLRFDFARIGTKVIIKSY